MSRSFLKNNRKNPIKNLNRRLHLEALEDRSLMSCNTISGFVYYDINNNGLYETNLGETPIANSTIELHNSSNVVVGSTTTDANGFYKFSIDETAEGDDATLTKTVTFPTTQTNFQLDGLLDQFDPSLGTLQSIEIRHAGSITSEIMAENYSDDSESDIAGTVSGTLTLTAPGVTDPLSITGYAGSFHAGVYDGNTDFAGTSGESFGEQTANGSSTITLTGADMNAYVGTGKVTVTETSNATSNATGGGNLDVRVRSTAQSTITVIYHYKEHACLAEGDYTIVQTQQPDTFLDGKEAKDGDVDANSVGTDIIAVTLHHDDLINNNFGEVKNTQISGHVWYDANNDGVRDATEDLIPGVTITLTGANGSQQTTTDANGFYAFTNLAAGTYTIKETQPTDYLDGQDNFGTKGGTVVNDPAEDQIQDITLVNGDVSENNDFGEIKPASIAGHVYYDADDDGTFDPGELPIGGATVTLTGFDDKGPVSKSMQTNAQGEYKFDGLRPGTYALNETQPAGYKDGKDTIGTPGGNTGNDVFDDIQLNAGVDGVNNDFGEVKGDDPVPGPKDQGLLGWLPFISKTQRTLSNDTSNIDPVVLGQMKFIVATHITLLGHQPNFVQTLTGFQALRNGMTQQGYIQQLWASGAHRALQANQLYQEVLDRAPTAQEKTATVAQLVAGSTENDIRESLYTTAEYGAAHNTQESLATALYKDIVNVTPGTTTTQALLQAMDTQPLNTVVHDLLNSDAGVANKIDDAYRQTLRRPATAAEVATWGPQIQNGSLTLDSLAQRLLATQEFYILAFNKIK